MNIGQNGVQSICSVVAFNTSLVYFNGFVGCIVGSQKLDLRHSDQCKKKKHAKGQEALIKPFMVMYSSSIYGI